MKRYTSEAQILEQIDKVKIQILSLRSDAEAEDRLADNHRHQDWIEIHIQQIRDHAEALRQEALRLERSKLTAMKEALSEFKTPPFPQMTDDGLVQPWGGGR